MTNKWVCKICNEKQSVLKVFVNKRVCVTRNYTPFHFLSPQTYGKGTGKECRIHVQKLNMLRAKEREVEDAKYCRQRSPQESPQVSANTFTPQGDRERNTTDSVRIGRRKMILVIKKWLLVNGVDHGQSQS